MIKVMRDHPQLQSIADRPLVSMCPHCDEDNHKDIYFWYKEIDTIVLNNQYRHKMDSFVMISVCPKCGEKSWNHFALNNMVVLCKHVFDDEPEAYNALKNELNRREKIMEKDWDESLCKNCSSVDSISTDYLYYRVNCSGNNSSKSGHCTSECDRFKAK